jgi:hypothetical protein
VALPLAASASPPLDRDGFLEQILDYLEVPEMKQAIETVRSVFGDGPHVVARDIGNGLEALEAVPAALQPFFPTSIRSRRQSPSMSPSAAKPIPSRQWQALSRVPIREKKHSAGLARASRGCPINGRLADILLDHATGPVHAND